MWSMKFGIAAVMAALICAAGSAWYAHNKGRASGMSQIQSQWDAERAALLAAQAEEMMKAQQRERALQALVDRQRRAHREEVDRVVREHAALVDGLRERPEARADNPAGLPEGSAPGVGCTGAGLSRGDAAFLAGFAADAARTQAALEACRAAYDALSR
jgi:hypothetical protein